SSTLEQSAYESWWVHNFLIETAVVVDHSLYVHWEKNVSKLQENLYVVVNIVDSIYEALGLKLLLFGLEVWTQANHIKVDDPWRSSTFFCRWKYENLASRMPHDTIHLFMHKTLKGLSGLSFIGGLCRIKRGCAIVTFLNKSLTIAAIAVAHHMGHNLGMFHDLFFCTCGKYQCIMHFDNPPITKFSN
ncbi:disintegrin and metalloproteinase domain-containing protein 29-like, partial [Pteropus alecto]